MADLLPNSLPNERKIDLSMSSHGMNWLYIYCASCGAEGGRVLENDYDFAFWLCDPCAEKYGAIIGTHMVPDSVFWEKVRQAQIEKYGRELSPYEVSEALKDDHHILSKLARERGKP